MSVNKPYGNNRVIISICGVGMRMRKGREEERTVELGEMEEKEWDGRKRKGNRGGGGIKEKEGEL